MTSRLLVAALFALTLPSPAVAFQSPAPQPVTNWLLQDATKVPSPAAQVSSPSFHPTGWLPATVPGTILTTLVDNHIYPEPLYGENMRPIPESLNRTSWWYRTTLQIPASQRGRHTWLHFAGINYASQIWLNGHLAASTRGAFIRTDVDITPYVLPGRPATLAVLVSPQPHPGIPHEHTVANGVGQNGGETALDGPTFLSTIGWDWLPAVRDRDTGIWLPVTLDSTGPLQLQSPQIIATLSPALDAANLTLRTTVRNLSLRPVTATLAGTISGPTPADTVSFTTPVFLKPSATSLIELGPPVLAALHLAHPKLWWPNGYGPQNLYHLTFRLLTPDGITSDTSTTQFGIRRIDYQVPDSENLTISINNVRIFVRGGNWGLDEALKRIPRARLDAQFHLHALANLNIIRNWVGQSTSPDFYDLADRYGILLWDEFFQPNPSDGPDPADIPTYLANVTDKVSHFRNHPSIAVWCARNEGYPPPALDAQLKSLVSQLDPTRLYQSNSADGRGVSSGGPYFWRTPREFYKITESFKTETGSMSIPTLESIQGMMPQRDWETINDDWAQHDFAKGAQRGDQFPQILAHRYGPIRNLADFARKGALATYEAFRAMYEGRNAQMFLTTSGILTWMSHPAQPSFVWQLYHYDLEPNAALFAAQRASEQVHIQLNEATGNLELINNRSTPQPNLTVRVSLYGPDSRLLSNGIYPVASVPASSVTVLRPLDLTARTAPLYFVKLEADDAAGNPLSSNFYWQNSSPDDLTGLAALPTVALEASATSLLQGDTTRITVTLHNPTPTIALMAHLQLHQHQSGQRILPVFYSANYLTLTPNDTQVVTLDFATRDLLNGTPEILIDGFNVGAVSTSTPISIQSNKNANPQTTPASQLVPQP